MRARALRGDRWPRTLCRRSGSVACVSHFRRQFLVDLYAHVAHIFFTLLRQGLAAVFELCRMFGEVLLNVV